MKYRESGPLIPEKYSGIVVDQMDKIMGEMKQAMANTERKWNMKNPNTYSLCSLIETVTTNEAEINGKWVPARPMGLPGLYNRVKVALTVFIGRADAVVWPEEQ